MSSSCTQLTRIVEDILHETFMCNKPFHHDTGHFARVSNFVEAANTGKADSPCQARFSSDMVVQVLQKYFAPGVVLLDPFVGSGTMFRACKKLEFVCTTVITMPVPALWLNQNGRSYSAC